ncbi:snurportin-1-like [Salvia splendens]|uniref:snurportin-1-like n=1 Tax=Salvia splendens TaxID=180675 RepID=UPI001C25601C|nr:snurportin-1-like [Salvia splendens]
MVREAERMIDVPDRLNSDWYVCARPAGKHCLWCHLTVSWLRNGCLLHRFPSALPNGASTNNSSRFFWLSSKLAESEACNDPSPYHKYRFMTLLVYSCDKEGLKAAYTGQVSYVKDGLLFTIRNTPLVLVWKDESCSQYVLDTESNGKISNQQQRVLELLDDGRLATFDDPPVILGCLGNDFVEKVCLNLFLRIHKQRSFCHCSFLDLQMKFASRGSIDKLI